VKDVVGGVKKDRCKTNHAKGRTTNALSKMNRVVFLKTNDVFLVKDVIGRMRKDRCKTNRRRE
jgi:hypothetical protein